MEPREMHFFSFLFFCPFTDDQSVLLSYSLCVLTSSWRVSFLFVYEYAMCVYRNLCVCVCAGGGSDGRRGLFQNGSVRLIHSMVNWCCALQSASWPFLSMAAPVEEHLSLMEGLVYSWEKTPDDRPAQEAHCCSRDEKLNQIEEGQRRKLRTLWENGLFLFHYFVFFLFRKIKKAFNLGFCSQIRLIGV